ncbi:MAG: TRZ/ATZ family hydrolase, partial [Gammaproteobacteria bacterium]
HSVAVKNGRIAGIMPTPRANSDYSASESVTLPGQVLMPGLINAHTHASMSLMRGMADDMPLMTWLQEQVWPVEAKWLSSGFVSDGAELAIAEMLLGGTTCFADMYFFPDAVAHAASRMGIRASIGIVVIQFPSRWAETESEYVSKGLAVRDAFNFDPLIGFHFAPHAPYTVTDESLASIHTLADELDMPIQMHVHETAHEVQTAVTESGKRPLQRLQEQGLLSPSFMAVHMTQLNDDEIRMLAATGIHVIHCPESNLKLASGFCPVATLLATGINVALGTDGAASNNDLDMLGEARTAALLAKGVSGNPEAVNSEQALQLATINGARALGLDEITGSLEPGKSADMISVDLACAATQPVYDPVSHLVYSACRDQVKNVWVSGKLRVVDGNLVGTDLDATIAKAKQWAKKIENSVDDK